MRFMTLPKGTGHSYSLGMSPSTWRKSGEGESKSHAPAAINHVPLNLLNTLSPWLHHTQPNFSSVCIHDSSNQKICLPFHYYQTELHVFKKLWLDILFKVTSGISKTTFQYPPMRQAIGGKLKSHRFPITIWKFRNSEITKMTPTL